MDDGTAYHEAAHAVAHIALGHPLYEVSADSDIEDKLGHTHGDVLTERLKQAKDWSAAAVGVHDRRVARDDTIILLVGEIAEARYFGTHYAFDPDDAPTSSDRQQVLARIAMMERDDSEGQTALFAELVSTAVELVKGNWHGITRVAQALTAGKVLDGAAVQALLFPDAGAET